MACCPVCAHGEEALGATAVQIVHSSRRGSRDIERIGSARDDVQVEVLEAAAPYRLAAGQDELDLARCLSCGSVCSRVHGGYARVVADGAARGHPLLVVLSMRRFRSLKPLCARAGAALAAIAARAGPRLRMNCPTGGLGADGVVNAAWRSHAAGAARTGGSRQR